MDPEVADQDPSMLRTRDGTIVLASFSWYPFTSAAAHAVLPPSVTEVPDSPGASGIIHIMSYISWGAFVVTSPDEGRSWSKRSYLPLIPGSSDEPRVRAIHGGAQRGSLCEHDGKIKLLTYCRGGRERFVAHLYEAETPRGPFHHASVMEPPFDPPLDVLEPSLYVTRDGLLRALFRTSGADDRIVSAYMDATAEWTWTLHDAKGHPSTPLVLSDGRTLITYGYRHAPFGIRARLLNEPSQNLDDVPEHILRDDLPTTDIGYPWSVELDDSEILVAYYVTTKDGTRRIEGTITDVVAFS